ncbi:MAG TPA: serine hydrolase domain-containing protein, partial [Gammaproteobacteria bacterium]|nr:serine hydrolase domain-containing protein [Gammaproteobacteria bacterium]
MMKKVLAVMGSITLTFSTLTFAVTPPANMDVILPQLEAAATQAMRASSAPGLAIAVVQGNQIVYLKGFGLREAGKTAPVTTDTVFRVASVSKTFASTLAGILVDKQQLNWTDRIVDFVPNFALKSATNTQSLTLKNVL